MMQRVTCSAFEKTDFDPRRYGKGKRSVREFDPEFRLFAGQMHAVAREHDVDLAIRGFKWPAIEPGVDITTLQDPAYKADLGVLFAESLNDVHVEIALLALGTRYPLHILVVTLRPCKNEHTEEIRSGLAALSRETFYRSEGELLQPAMNGEYDCYNLEQAGHLHFFDTRSLRSDETRSRLHAIFL